MATHTTITDPEGHVTTVVTRSGCGCPGCLWALLALFVIAVPAAYFSLPWAVLAYVFEAAIAAAAAWQAIARHRTARRSRRGARAAELRRPVKPPMSTGAG